MKNIEYGSHYLQFYLPFHVHVRISDSKQHDLSSAVFNNVASVKLHTMKRYEIDCEEDCHHIDP